MSALTTPMSQIEDRLVGLVEHASRPDTHKPNAAGATFERMWTRSITGNPLDAVEYELRSAIIRDGSGNVMFEQSDVEVPKFWSQLATGVVASKYFRGTLGSADRESSVRQVIHRVAATIAEWAAATGYWADGASALNFYHELCYILVHQIAAFNSPVWFNVGFEKAPQGSACFICSVQDSMESIMQLATSEAAIFKGGSGAGSNLSTIRSSKEGLSGGGLASGPVSFMRGYDAFAGVIKSGGRTRRAAKMTLLNDSHPDVLEFIRAKPAEEKKAWALIEKGYDPDFNGEAYGSVFFQNANLSVRVTDGFMEAATTGGKWPLRAVHTNEATGVRAGDIIDEIDAREMLRAIAEGTWICGDPGMQFDDTIEHWNPMNEKQHASNPCCFVGETLVDTSEGRIPIADLEAMCRSGETLPHAFGFDRREELPVLKPITRAWVAGLTSSLVEVATDKGIRVRCTPDHRFLLHNGEYVEARELVPGTRLRKIGRGASGRHCRTTIQHRVTDNAPNGCVYQSRFMWEQVHGEIPNGHHVHHRNGKRRDDRLSNLELVPDSDHWSDHARGEKNPRYIDVEEQKLLEVWDAVEALPRRTHKSHPVAVTPSRWNRYIRENGLQGVVPFANAARGIRGQTWAEFREWIEQQKSAVNDRVQSVTVVELDEPVPVYDIEVAEVHNFGVSNDPDGGAHSIVVSNSEFLYLDDTACNLSSLNLMKFRVPGDRPGFDVVAFRSTVRTMITAMEVIVDNSSYPTERIRERSRALRPLGIGYSNLGALLMAYGAPYDSEEGRAIAAGITSLMTAEAYAQSGEWAAAIGPFPEYENHREQFVAVMERHRQAAVNLRDRIAKEGHPVPDALLRAGIQAWGRVVASAEEPGIRNGQASVLAPTGTISFFMDCDTTGVEPDIALVKYKRLVGRGMLKMVNHTVPAALERLGYDEKARAAILEYLDEHDTIEGAPGLKGHHLPVFDCAFKPKNGMRSIPWHGHVKMVAAVQPFLSGAASKTINLPESATVEDIEQAYIKAWQLGIKCVAIYREGSKRTAPLSTSKDIDEMKESGRPVLERRRLPDTRASITHKFTVGGHKGYITVGMYPDGTPGEIFAKMAKEGSVVSGLTDAFATATSIALQHGIPLSVWLRKFKSARFEPAGLTSNREIPTATSILDYMMKWLEHRFVPDAASDESTAEVAVPNGLNARDTEKLQLDRIKEMIDQPDKKPDGTVPAEMQTIQMDGAGKPCHSCGGLMARIGGCWHCLNCFATGGCG